MYLDEVGHCRYADTSDSLDGRRAKTQRELRRRPSVVKEVPNAIDTLRDADDKRGEKQLLLMCGA